MSFTRYEIRSYYREDNDFTYIPFDTLAEAEAYANEHKDITSSENVLVGIYKVTLFSHNEVFELIKKL